MCSQLIQQRSPAIAHFFANGGRIGVFGASGSGKTRFCEYLASTFGVSLKSEGVREWLQDRGLRYSTLTAQESMELQSYCLEQCERSSAAIFDRTPLDALVYASLTVPDSQLEQIRQRVPPLLARISLLVFFPAYGGFLADDGVRISDLKHQTEVGSLMFLQAKRLGVLHKVVVYDHSQPIENNVSTIERAVSA